MRRISELAGKIAVAAGLALALALQCPAAFAGDSLYGKVTAVKSADLVTFDHGAGSYDIRLAGIEVPKERGVDREAAGLTATLLLDKPARLRFEGRTAAGEMIGRIYTDDPRLGIKDVGIELVRAGMAMAGPRRPAYSAYKYGELEEAMAEARAKKVGLWSDPR